MLLKWLMDDIISADTKMIIEKINEHNQRITALEKSQNKEQPIEETNMKRMTDGSQRRIKK